MGTIKNAFSLIKAIKETVDLSVLIVTKEIIDLNVCFGQKVNKVVLVWSLCVCFAVGHA